PKEAYALIGTVLGAGITLAGVIFTGFVQPIFARQLEKTRIDAVRDLEERKLKAARQDALNKDIGLRVAQLTADLASAAHSMAWLTWAANRDVITRARIDSYDTEMHAVLTKLPGDVVAVAAVDEELGKLATKMADWIYRSDVEIGEACV